MGAPSVIITTWSTSLKLLVRAMVDTNRKVGARSGKVIFLKIVQESAPSILAASFTSSEILWMPDRKNTIRYPASFHTYITAIAGSTVLLFESTFIGSSPKLTSIWSNSPFFAI